MEAADVVRERRGGRRGSQGRRDDGEARRITALGTIKHAKVGSCLNTSGWQPLANNTLVTELTTCTCTTSTKYYNVPSK